MRDAAPHRPKVERSGDLTILTITARATGGGLARELGALGADAGARHVSPDFAHVRFVSGTELGTLVGLHNRVAAAGGRLTLFNLSADVLRLFSLTRLDTLLDVCRPCASPAGTWAGRGGRATQVPPGPTGGGGDRAMAMLPTSPAPGGPPEPDGGASGERRQRAEQNALDGR